jgi:membrane fusion protein, copper/silver efflux system
MIALIAVGFVAGLWCGRGVVSSSASTGEHKVLYYRCPMHPQHISDHPGDAPCCGMRLEPVYAGAASKKEQNSEAPVPAGTVRVSAGTQQLMGVKSVPAGKYSGEQVIRIIGRVVPDENRLYRINAATDGWFREIFTPTTGSLVRKDELLAKIYAPETFSAMKAYMYGLRSLDRFTTGQETKEQIDLTNDNIENYRNALRNVGMSDYQLDKIKRTRQGENQVEIRATAAGFILTRNASLGQRFEKGTELYQIADLSHVWVLADIFENEGKYFLPGSHAKVTLVAQKKLFNGRVSEVLPIFDPVARTLKVRLEVSNPEFLLRPDMFVDVELSRQAEPALTVPSQAVLNTGRKSVVFVDKGNGYFEPRRIETGWSANGQTQVTGGLKEGEQIVVSGNFLIDSESQMQLASTGLPHDFEIDPVCGMEVNPHKPDLKKSEQGGRTYYFCSDICKAKFDKAPGKYGALNATADKGESAMHGVPAAMVGPEKSQAAATAKDPVCGMDVNLSTPGVLKADYQNKTYFFCSGHCKKSFEANPEKYISNSGKSMAAIGTGAAGI